MAELRLTAHATWQMERRGISIEAVKHVLEHYHNSRPAPRREGALPAVIYIGAYEQRDLKIYVVRDSDPSLVATAVWEGD